MHNPWTDLDRLRGWRVDWAHLEHDAGCTVFSERRIILDTGLPWRVERCTLQHEVIHAERGPVIELLREREELAVEAESAGRLIDLQPLGEALAWSLWPDEVAEELDVDRPTLLARMAALQPAEARHLRERTVHHREDV